MSSINDNYARALDLNLLRVFMVVAEEGSMTRAASRLYVTQPAVSASIRRLTTFVGTDLLTRQGHGVVLTTRGTELLSAARIFLPPLLAAATAASSFDPKSSKATIRMGLADGVEGVLLPGLLERLRHEAPDIQVVALAVQFRTVEEMLLANKIHFAVTVADDLPRSILRRPLSLPETAARTLVCLYDPRFIKLARPMTERHYFAQDHVAVSYAGDARGIVEDATGKSRRVRVSVPSFSYVPDVVDGSSLVATVPLLFARHVLQTRPHLRTVALPVSVEGVSLELLWSRVNDDDVAGQFVRGLVEEIVAALDRTALISHEHRAPRQPSRGIRSRRA